MGRLRSHAAAEALRGAGARVSRHRARTHTGALGTRGGHQWHTREYCQVIIRHRHDCIIFDFEVWGSALGAPFVEIDKPRAMTM